MSINLANSSSNRIKNNGATVLVYGNLFANRPNVTNNIIIKNDVVAAHDGNLAQINKDPIRPLKGTFQTDINNNSKIIRIPLTATTLKDGLFNFYFGTLDTDNITVIYYNIPSENNSLSFKTAKNYPSIRYYKTPDEQKPLFNEYVQTQMLEALLGADSKSKYFDGVQTNGLYGLDIFLNYYDNNVNTGTNDNSEATKNFVRNPHCWAYNFDLTCCSPWNMHPTLRTPTNSLVLSSNFTAGTLVSPRHALFCNHASFYPPVGSELRFITKDNVTITRTLTNVTPIVAADIVVGILDSDVPDSISFAKILPDDWADKILIDNIQDKENFPIFLLRTNQDECALLLQLDKFGDILTSSTISPDSPYYEFYKPIRLYDSGNPFFIILDNQPILWGISKFINTFKREVNAAMLSLGTDYQLTPVDLSRFRSLFKPVIAVPPPLPVPVNPVPPDSLPTVLNGCNFPDSVNYIFEFVGNSSWIDSNNGAYIIYDIDIDSWKIVINLTDTFYSKNIFEPWYIIADGLIDGYTANQLYGTLICS